MYRVLKDCSGLGLLQMTAKYVSRAYAVASKDAVEKDQRLRIRMARRNMAPSRRYDETFVSARNIGRYTNRTGQQKPSEVTTSSSVE